MKTDNDKMVAGQGAIGPFPRRRHAKSNLQGFDPRITKILEERRAEFLLYLRSRLRDCDDAEDVLQDFCIKVLAKSGQIRNESSTTAWLRTVLKSVLADYFRHKAAERSRFQELAADWRVMHDQAGPPVLGEINPDQTECSCLHKMLPKLKSEYTDVILRVDLAQESRAEAASALGTTTGNVRVRLHRARRALKEALRTSCRQCQQEGCFERDESDRPGEAEILPTV